MKKKISIILIMFMVVFTFVPALTMAQDGNNDGQESGLEENEEDLMNEEEDSDTKDNEEIEQISEELKEVLESDYASVEEFLTALNDKDLLTVVEEEVFERKLSSYNENLSLDTITSVVNKVLTEEIDLGQGFVVLNNLNKSISNGFKEETALEMINNYQNEENSGQFTFQFALELRKLSREDHLGDQSEAFANEIASIIKENGEIETSELKQLAAEYRKNAREENREQMRADRSEKSNSASENALENRGKNNNASENALNKENNGNGDSNSSKAEDKANNKDSNKSSNFNDEMTKK